jgi:rhodanese-related sulfurtransferase
MPTIAHRAFFASALAALALARPAGAFQDGPLLLEHEVLVSPVDLAAHPKVQQEIGVDESTQGKILELAKQLHEQSSSILRDRSIFPTYRSTALQHLRERMEKELDKLLDAKQRQRLEEIRLQYDGYIALSRPELTEQFSLNMAQGPMTRQAVRELHRQQLKLLIDMRYDEGEAKLEDIPKRMTELKKEFNDRLEKELNAKQLALWKQITGKPFKVVLTPFEYTSDPLKKVKELTETEKAVLVDVRDEKEWDEGHLEGAILLPYSEMTSKENRPRTLRRLLLTVPREKRVFCYSSSGRRALVAANLVRDLGYDAQALKEGYVDLVDAGFAPSK